jgi:hypothetical protein
MSDATTAIDEAQITAPFDPPTDQRELIRHYTLSAADLAAIRRCRGDHNRLGHALMLCYLRYPGRPLKAGERPPRPLNVETVEQAGYYRVGHTRHSIRYSPATRRRRRILPTGDFGMSATKTYSRGRL